MARWAAARGGLRHGVVVAPREVSTLCPCGARVRKSVRTWVKARRSVGALRRQRLRPGRTAARQHGSTAASLPLGPLACPARPGRRVPSAWRGQEGEPAPGGQGGR